MIQQLGNPACMVPFSMVVPSYIVCVKVCFYDLYRHTACVDIVQILVWGGETARLGKMSVQGKCKAIIYQTQERIPTY